MYSTSFHDHHASSPFHVTSPIPLEDIRSIRKDLADDPNIPKDVLLRAMADLSQFQVSVNEHKAKLEQDFTVRFETGQKAMLQEMQKHMDAFDNFREQALQENKSLRAELTHKGRPLMTSLIKTMQLGKTWQMKMLPYLIKSKHLNMNLVTYPTFKVGLMNNWKPLMSLEDSQIDPPLPIHKPIPSSQPWCPAGFDNTAMFQPLLESLDWSINL